MIKLHNTSRHDCQLMQTIAHEDHRYSIRN